MVKAETRQVCSAVAAAGETKPNNAGAAELRRTRQIVLVALVISPAEVAEGGSLLPLVVCMGAMPVRRSSETAVNSSWQKAQVRWQPNRYALARNRANRPANQPANGGLAAYKRQFFAGKHPIWCQPATGCTAGRGGRWRLCQRR
ncbi:hypothetical protein AVEN_14664-1 [Araneus ventricosus]|uniref:Uncharacterized protein n=1 Tax=Araneus ventricosus TaxID=182803 RepID=A0A4Y2IE96_ARAVE|nr:hypothetical protein AVEN_14664-1 [Araneus ventricosus]